jgi:cytochrome P450
MKQPPSLEISRWEGLRLLRRSPIALFERAATLGDVVHIPLPRRTVLLVNRPELVWAVLATHARDVRKSPVLRGARRVLGDGLLTSEGELHRKQRLLMQPLFHHERIADHGPTMVELADRATARWRDGQEMDLHAEMARLTLSIVASTVFDADIDDAGALDVGRALGDVLEHFDRLFSPFLPLWERLPLPSTLRYRRAKGTFDRTVGEMIAGRRAAGASGTDLLSFLIHAQEDGTGMTDRQVRDEAVTLFLAGHETTSNALAWTWHLLSEAPEAEARMHGELDRVLGGRAPALEDLAHLAYVEAVLHESMRLRPPAWAIGREVTHAFDADGVPVEPGSVVVVSPWLLHHDARWWGADAAAFRPERWLDEAERPRHAFLPFGGGPRMCIGEGFAMMEARLLIAAIARSWRFRADPAHQVELQPVITLRPRSGLRVRAFRRRGAPTR